MYWLCIHKYPPTDSGVLYTFWEAYLPLPPGIVWCAGGVLNVAEYEPNVAEYEPGRVRAVWRAWDRVARGARHVTESAERASACRGLLPPPIPQRLTVHWAFNYSW